MCRAAALSHGDTTPILVVILSKTAVALYRGQSDPTLTRRSDSIVVRTIASHPVDPISIPHVPIFVEDSIGLDDQICYVGKKLFQVEKKIVPTAITSVGQ